MKKLISFVLLVLVLPLQMVNIFAGYAEDPPEAKWVLKEIVDYDLAEKTAEFNKDYEGVYTSEFSYARCNYYEKRSYVGNSDTWYDPPKVKGGHLAVTVTWSTPPSIIKAGEEVALSMSISVSSNTQSFFGFANSTSAAFDIPDIKPGYGTSEIVKFYDEDGNDHFRVYSKHYDAISKTVTATPRNGTSEGDQISLTIGVSVSGGRAGTKYIYEWMSSDEQDEETQPPVESDPVENRITNKYGRDLQKYVVPKLDGKYKDSGVRFGDLSGDVQIRHADDKIGWEFAEMDTIICVGDVVRTGNDSICILSLSDMTTFEMRPNSEVFMNTETEKQSQITLLFGKMLANAKKMIIDGSMSVEMSQAVAGIKGTTFVVESNDTESTLMVLEGTVEFLTNDGETLIVNSNEMVTAKNGEAGGIEPFSAIKELSTWSDTIQAEINSRLEEQEIILDENYGSTKYLVYLLIFLIAVLIIVIALMLSKKRKAKKTRFCRYCGAKIPKRAKTCPSCKKEV